MRKTIELFFQEAKYWQVFIGLFILMFIFVFSLLSFLTIKEQFITNLPLMVKLTILLALIFSIMGSFLTYVSRKSVVFWKHSEKIFCKIDEATTKEELDNIYTNDFEKLKKMSMGGLHNQELIRLYTIMDTKHRYIK